MDNSLIEDTIHQFMNNYMNVMLTNLPSFEEIKIVVYGMNTDSALELDGFGAYFYHKYLDVIDQDVFQTILQFILQD